MYKEDFKRRTVYFIGLFLISGYAMGCIFIRAVPFSEQLADRFIENAGLLLSALECTAVAALVYLSGFSVIGAYFDCVIVYFRMAVMGYFMAGYYSLYGINGIWRVLLFGLPVGAVMTVVLLLLASESVCASVSILSGDDTLPVKINGLKQYAGSGLFLILCTLISVTWRGLIAPYLANFIFK